MKNKKIRCSEARVFEKINFNFYEKRQKVTFGLEKKEHPDQVEKIEDLYTYFKKATIPNKTFLVYNDKSIISLTITDRRLLGRIIWRILDESL